MAIRQAHSVIQSKINFPITGSKVLETYRLTLFTEKYAICRLSPEDPIPSWALHGPFYAIIRTPEELSILCPAQSVPPGIRCQTGFRALKVHGPLEFSEIGVLARLTGSLAAASIPILAISTFDTDYLLVQENLLEQAAAALQASGVAKITGS